jgi:hypothetical protein
MVQLGDGWIGLGPSPRWTSASVVLGVFIAGLLFCGAPALGAEQTVLAHSLGKAGSGEGQLSEPAAVALGPGAGGEVYVLDKGNDRVERFTSGGSYVGQFNGSGLLPGEGSAAPTGQLSAPDAIAVDDSTSPSDPSAGDVYVADAGHDVIDKFSATGHYEGQLTGTTGGSFGSVEGVAVDPAGNVFVYAGEEYIDEFNDALGNGFLSQVEGVGGALGIAVDSQDDVYVVRSYNHTLAKFAAGEFTGYIGECECAAGVGVDPVTSNVYVSQGTSVAEYGPYAIPAKTPLAQFGSGDLQGASGIAVSPGHEVYVADSTADDVDVFTTVVLPDTTTGSATSITGTSASLSGSVNADGTSGASYYFQYGTSSAYGSTSPAAPGTPISGSSTIPATASLTGLASDSTYYYRLDTTNSSGYVNYGQGKTFSTPPVAATVNDRPPTVNEVLASSARLTGTIDAENSQTFYYFEYGPTTAYGSTTPTVDAGIGDEDELVAQRLTGLTPGTTYHYALVASNPGGTTTGPDYTFTTAPPTPPVIATGPASSPSATAETVTGTIEPRSLPTTYQFEIGTSTSYGGILAGSVEVLEGAQSVTQTFQGLPLNTTYHYRLVATNEDGTTYGPDQTFSTPGYPNPLAEPALLPAVATPTIVFPATQGATQPAKTKTKKTKAKSKKTKGKKTKGKAKLHNAKKRT